MKNFHVTFHFDKPHFVSEISFRVSAPSALAAIDVAASRYSDSVGHPDYYVAPTRVSTFSL
jgi:hypothetical protein